MAKSVNKWHVISDEFLRKFSLVNEGNIKYFFDNINTLFIVVEKVIETSNKKEFNSVVNQFQPRVKFIKGKVCNSSYINDNKLLHNQFTIYTTESDEQYNQLIGDMKTLIKGYMKNKTLYAIITK